MDKEIFPENNKAMFRTAGHIVGLAKKQLEERYDNETAKIALLGIQKQQNSLFYELERSNTFTAIEGKPVKVRNIEKKFDEETD